jgi:Fe-S-cluster containining protein
VIEEMTKDTIQTSCHQCGICCTNGGAALHCGDISLLQQGLIPRRDLITIRKGEFAHNPVSGKVQATKNEIVKLRGTGREWTCCYYDPATKGCTIYDNRPLACSTLKCWDPQESLKLVETDLLSRLDILAGDDALRKLVKEYESKYPLPDFTSLALKLTNQTQETIALLEESVNGDLEFRNQIVALSDSVLQEEMFLFGRPLFQLLQPFGLDIVQRGTRLSLRVKDVT